MQIFGKSGACLQDWNCLRNSYTDGRANSMRRAWNHAGDHRFIEQRVRNARSDPWRDDSASRDGCFCSSFFRSRNQSADFNIVILLSKPVIIPNRGNQSSLWASHNHISVPTYFIVERPNTNWIEKQKFAASRRTQWASNVHSFLCFAGNQALIHIPKSSQKRVFSALVAFIRREFKLDQHQIRGGWVVSEVLQVSPTLMTNATVKGSIFSHLSFAFCPVQAPLVP